MGAATWTAMLVICGIVWGGFALLLLRALRSEASKTSAESSNSGAS